MTPEQIRNAALEEAAQEAEACDYPRAAPDYHEAEAYDHMAARIASAIRALKEQEPQK